MDERRQDDQLEPIYNSSVPIQGVALKTNRERWTIEMSGKKGSERSVLAARHDDDDDDDVPSLKPFKLDGRDMRDTAGKGLFSFMAYQPL